MIFNEKDNSELCQITIQSSQFQAKLYILSFQGYCGSLHLMGTQRVCPLSARRLLKSCCQQIHTRYNQ